MTSTIDDNMILDNNLSTKCSYSNFWHDINYILKNNTNDFIGDIMQLKSLDIEYFNKYAIFLKK
jgi:hypothetical protein